MADAIPVASEGDKKPTKKGASASVAADTKAAVAAQAKPAATPDNPYKVEGGVELGTHKAVREDR